jgi:CHAD domain-containing protein
MRALARLLRYELGDQEFDRVNSSLRLAGRHLAGARDAGVRADTLQQLVARHPSALALDGVAHLAERLADERERGGEPTDPREALCDIAEMHRVLDRWNLVDPDFAALSPGLRRIYREGRQRYERARRDRVLDAEHLHDSRKRVKALYYALDMLGASEERGTRSLTRRAKQLGELLGEEHDLWMLCAYIEGHEDACGHDARARRTLLKLIERRRERLRRRALSLGRRLYKRKPRKFVRHVNASLAR